MSIISLVRTFSQMLEKNNQDNPKRTIEELIAYHLDCKPLEIYNHNIENTIDIEKDVKRLLNNEPLQYIIGNVNFFGIEFNCDSRALIPRPETELLIETILDSDIWDQSNPTVLDIGTGSGCIAVSLANTKPQIYLDAVDISLSALELAKENAKKLNLKNIHFYPCNILEDFPPKKYDAVISNPPYIPTKEWENLHTSVKDFEPRNALDAGDSGLEYILEIVKNAHKHLNDNGMIFLEIGYDQSKLVTKILIENGFNNVTLKVDYQGINRVITGNK